VASRRVSNQNINTAPAIFAVSVKTLLLFTIMPGHGHSHGHGHSCEGDSDSHESPEMGIEYSLYSKIDMENLECLNEAIEGSGKSIFKPWEERLNLEKVSTFISSCYLVNFVIDAVVHRTYHGS